MQILKINSSKHCNAADTYASKLVFSTNINKLPILAVAAPPTAMTGPEKKTARATTTIGPNKNGSPDKRESCFRPNASCRGARAASYKPKDTIHITS